MCSLHQKLPGTAKGDSYLRNVSRLYVWITVLGLSGAMLSQAQTTGRSLTEVYQNNDFQLTGISVSKTGRLLINFPRCRPSI